MKDNRQDRKNFFQDINTNLKELAKFLDDKEVGKIHYCKKYRYFKIDTDFDNMRKELQNKINDPIMNKSDIQVGWTVELCGKSDNITEEFFNRYIKDFDFKNDIKHFDHNDKVHRGHYLANMFKNYLLKDGLSSKNTSHFFGKGNIRNIYFQSAQSNTNSTDVRGQSYFENEIVKFLKEDDGRKVLFQIEDYRVEEKSLGRRILAVFFDENGNVSDEFGFHVIIPNVEI
ncbi:MULTISPECIES: hypothetical protein [unclassified Enterococcus]|uniref:hypothetical protein n=1 Tax=unclassified Enterococcus TaxID=2608891 RepID=UPI001556F31D|nr:MULTISPECIES: hypothetical protein [unclassified Enterococcus]MBS7577688.1 hypothetical protein [Enterococcus sp. MMGLQ5-2]MBS7584118.1 hypothetical protein [Enterococcus sp. MMGLQ5-1]NPD11979.1 hypothetical protein [Enterococcus sp. MMGLQ5-1]NPD37518.1 hypothetical protein [Enterococcus sp. MMGLQ5-2]